MERGMEIIATNNPGHYDRLMKNLKKIMLFSSEVQNSFAVMTAHNMIFLNVHPWDDEIFFADHISHEGGHLVFYTLTFESKYQLFQCSFHTPIGNFIGELGKYGSVYMFFHGLSTFVEITTTLVKCIDDPIFSDRQRRDTIGRFIFHMHRFKNQLKTFDEIAIFEPEGQNWFFLFKKVFASMEPKFAELQPLYSLANQPYDFNSKVFAELNEK
jgi:hypothetical protein